jgi:hypothetical protein
MFITKIMYFNVSWMKGCANVLTVASIVVTLCPLCLLQLARWSPSGVLCEVSESKMVAVGRAFCPVSGASKRAKPESRMADHARARRFAPVIIADITEKGLEVHGCVFYS